jgi:phosphoserine phosphatase RsbU/P
MDLNTVIIVNIVLQICICIITYDITKKMKIVDIKIWNIGNIIYIIGFILLSTQEVFNPFVSVLIANILTEIGISILVICIMHLKELNFSCEFISLNILFLICFLYVHRNTEYRIVVISVFASTIYSYLFYKLYRVDRLFKNSSISILNIVLILSCIFYSIRIVYTLKIVNIEFIFDNADKFTSYIVLFQIIFFSVLNITLYQIVIKKYEEQLQLKIKELEENKIYINKMNKQFISDINSAKSIQDSLLPEKRKTINSIKFISNLIPTEKLSGDSYNFFSIDKNSTLAYISDVSGHGVSAAMLTIFLNQCIRSAIHNTENSVSPSKILKYLYDEYNESNFSDEKYIVLFLFIYNTETKKVYYSSAGLNSEPIYISKNGECRFIHIEGFPILKSNDIYVPQYINYEIDIHSNDKIFLCTDGLSDLRNKSGKMYTNERIFDIISKKNKSNSDEINETIKNDILLFLDGCDDINNYVKDDIAYMIVEFNFENL